MRRRYGFENMTVDEIILYNIINGIHNDNLLKSLIIM